MRNRGQADLFATESARSLLDELLSESKLYKKGKDYLDLLEFVAGLRNFAPFNAMLLQIQKPGLTYAASAADWQERFNRRPKEAARPLLILWPFGPVALVYDVLDTEGDPLPQDVASFHADGDVDQRHLAACVKRISVKGIEWYPVDAGDANAGLIRVATDDEDHRIYRIHINRNHAPAVQFNTLTHELGHALPGSPGS